MGWYAAAGWVPDAWRGVILWVDTATIPCLRGTNIRQLTKNCHQWNVVSS
jgi:hypothetical protein